jgi:hypothetical protein
LPLPATAVQNTIPKTEVKLSKEQATSSKSEIESKKADIERRWTRGIEIPLLKTSKMLKLKKI